MLTFTDIKQLRQALSHEREAGHYTIFNENTHSCNTILNYSTVKID